MSSSLSRPFSHPFFFLFEIFVDKVSATSRSRYVATLERHDVGLLSCLTSTSQRLNVETLGLGSPIYSFKPPHSLQMPPFSPKMHKKLSIKYKAINTLINV